MVLSDAMSEKVSSGQVTAAAIEAGTIPVNRIVTFSSAATMERTPSVIDTDVAFAKVKATKNGKGGGVLKGLRIFKSGSFKDSMGYEHTWEATHLEQMAFHFRLLRDGGYFPNVPVRVDHSFSAKDVVGYFSDVYRADDDDTFLAADIEITEPDAYEKWERGTFRSRSLEVGMYETNDGAAYWPVIMGLAFVDIPAVEGLHGRKSPAMSFSQVIRDNQEVTPVGDQNQNTGTEGTQTPPADQGTQTPPADQGTQTPPADQGTQTPPADQGTQTPPAEQTPPADQGTQTPPAEQTPPAQHSAPAGTFSFRVNGQPTTDFASVQRHIEALETFQTETISTGRADFVTGLATAGVIAATQVDSLTALAQTMTNAQFDSFRDSYKDVAPSGLFARHGDTPATGQAPGTAAAAADEIATLEETVANHRRAGMTQERIEKTPSFQRLQALKAAQANA